MHRFLWALGALTLALPLAVQAAPPADLNDLSLELRALQVLHQVDLTRGQLDMLAQMAKSTAEKPRKRQPAKATPSARNLLAGLHTALAKGDDKQIEALTQQLGELDEKSMPDVDDGVEGTEVARKRAAEVVRLLTPRQTAVFLSRYTDFKAPAERLSEALEQGRTMPAEEWNGMRDSLAEEAAWLIAGSDVTMAAPVRAKLVTLLEQARKAPEKDWKAKKADFEKQVSAIYAKVSPLRLLQNVMERDLADLLANPRLAEAVKARVQGMAQTK